MTHKIKISRDHSVEIVFGAFSGGEIPEKAVLIVDEGVDFEWGHPTLRLPGGESLKAWSTVQGIHQFLFDHRIGRSDCVVAVGGGALLDVVGFSCSVYKRGVAWWAVPTTLLAQIDASVGGKTAINTAEAKNSIGSFYPAQKTVIDTSFLQTLDQRQINSGLAEILKIALLADEAFLGQLSALPSDWYHRPSVREQIVKRAVDLKLAVIGDDWFDEGGNRKHLNLGHTLGHAFEKMYPELYHGEAISLGMLAEAEIFDGFQGGSASSKAIRAHLEKLGLPSDFRKYGKGRASDLLNFMEQDKKREGEKITFVVVNPIANPHIVELERSSLKEIVEQFFL